MDYTTIKTARKAGETLDASAVNDAIKAQTKTQAEAAFTFAVAVSHAVDVQKDPGPFDANTAAKAAHLAQAAFQRETQRLSKLISWRNAALSAATEADETPETPDETPDSPPSDIW